MKGPRRRGPLLATFAVVGSLAGVMSLSAATVASATPAGFPTVTLTNDANQPGVFGSDEAVPKNATYPYSVTFQVALGAAGNGTTPLIDAIVDTAGASGNGTCPALIGTHLPLSGASCTYTVTLSGPQSTAYSDTVRFEFAGGGGDNIYSTSTIEFPAMTVAKSSTTQFVGAIGQVVPYSYTITNTGTTALTGVSLADNNTDAAPSCPSTTLALGASMNCTAQHTVTASDLTASSLNNLATASSNEAPNATATYSIPVLASLGGSFVIGDLTYAANPPSVNFWGAQWWKNNSLSGGTGPAAFKGFEDSPAAPTCGQNWTTDPGNSTPPPAGPLPPYIAVIVSSKVTQTGSTIGGDTQHVVVVQTNSGYQGNPGHAGTGPIVATLC